MAYEVMPFPAFISTFTVDLEEAIESALRSAERRETVQDTVRYF